MYVLQYEYKYGSLVSRSVNTDTDPNFLTQLVSMGVTLERQLTLYLSNTTGFDFHGTHDFVLFVFSVTQVAIDYVCGFTLKNLSKI